MAIKLFKTIFKNKRLDDLETRFKKIEETQEDLKKANQEILDKLQIDLHKALELQEENKKKYAQFQKEITDYFDFNK
jgi:peptidoglycan hydrolase CwlO-like protein